MKKSICIFTLMLLGSIILIGCSQKAQNENILAKFDKQVITLEELDKEISELPEWQQDKYKAREGKEEYLTLMAESRMVLQYAKEKKLYDDPEIIRQTQEYKEQLMSEELEKREVEDKVKVGEPDIVMHYEANKADYIDPEKVTVTEVTLEDEEKAKDIHKRVTEDGEDFTALAKEMSDNRESIGPGQGNEGKATFTKDSYSQSREFVEGSFAIEIGQITYIVQPMDDKSYYMIVRLDERVPETQKGLSEVRDRIERTVEREKKEELRDKWIEDLKSQKKVQLFTDKIPETPKEEAEEIEEEQETPESTEEIESE